ncbi:MAG: hypothetical protein PVF17_00600 [Ignavibacteria bacterium]
MSDLIPSDNEMTVFKTMAMAASKSNLYQRFGGYEGIMTILLTARELGLPPMLSLAGGIHIIKGNIMLSARSMNALIRRDGHKVETITTGDTVCTLRGTRKDGETMEVSFFIEEAKRAGLIKEGSGWAKCPNDMLYARALSRLARRLFPDVIGTCYIDGEIPTDGDSDRNIVESNVIDVEIEKPNLEPITDHQHETLLQHIIDDDHKSKVLDYFDVTSLEQLRQCDYETIMRRVDNGTR